MCKGHKEYELFCYKGKVVPKSIYKDNGKGISSNSRLVPANMAHFIAFYLFTSPLLYILVFSLLESYKYFSGNFICEKYFYSFSSIDYIP